MGDLERAIRQLVRLGYDQINGYLRGGLEAWYEEGLNIEYLGLLSVKELKEKLENDDDLLLLDLRWKTEWLNGHIKGATNIFF